MATAISTLFRSTSFESIHEAQAYSEARSKNLLPEDAWTEGVGDGHYIAFFSHDEAACEAINRRIAARVFVFDTTEDADGNEIELKTGYPRLDWTPQRGVNFTGWAKVF